MIHRLWLARMRIGELKQRLMAVFQPQRLKYIGHSWPLRARVCPCDLHFCDYLQERDIRGLTVFHFGTGGHHLVGTRNRDNAWNNEILGLTISPSEYAKYMRRLIREPSLGRRYKVLFADVHSLSARILPDLDVISLFHLCEFSDPASSCRRLDEDGVLRLFCSRMSPGGRLLLYRDSFAFSKVEPLIARAVCDGLLSFIEDYKSLSVYAKPRSAD